MAPVQVSYTKGYQLPNGQIHIQTTNSNLFSSQQVSTINITDVSSPSLPLSQQLQQVPSILQPRTSYPPDLLLGFYNPVRKEQIKAQNLNKYELKKDSPIYSFSLSFLNRLITKYPEQFAPDLYSKTQTQVRALQNQSSNFLSCALAGIAYWTVLRRRLWFKITGNGFMRLYFVTMCLYSFFQRHVASGEYLYDTVYQNKTDFQKVLLNHKINANQITPQQMFERI